MIYILLSLLAGAVLPLQALINARLAAGVGSSLWAAAISFQVGALGLLLVQLALRAPWPELGRVASVPSWIWSGGLFGAVYVASVIASVPRLGAASVISLVIFGQLTASLLLEHFGGVGAGTSFREFHAADWRRAASRRRHPDPAQLMPMTRAPQRWIRTGRQPGVFAARPRSEPHVTTIQARLRPKPSQGGSARAQVRRFAQVP
jgi:bacterial/archaeal transporter family-2 protein